MEPKIHLYEHKVQYYETDQMSIVHHSNYIRWFEEARNTVLEDHGFGYAKMEECGIIIPVIGVKADYKTMTHFGETVVIETSIIKYTGTRLILGYTIKDRITGEIRCLGESSHCFLDGNSRPVSLKRKFPEIHQVFENLK